MSFKNTLLIALSFGLSSAIAQSTSQICLVDMDDNAPIMGATFKYGTQTGISNDEGVIIIELEPGNSMQVSHISYGIWEWNEEELRKHIKEKVVSLVSNQVNLYPVTVIALRPGLKPHDRINIDFQERMEHDGADILNQIPAINSIRKGGCYGFDPVFRGYKYEQLNVVMNGAQSATAACPNRMDPPTSQMAPNMMDRVEVLKGPHALRFGTGFGGTINFIPSKLRFSESPKVYGRASTGYESNGNLMRGESQIGLSGKKYDLSLFAAWSEGDDYQTGEAKDVQSDFQRGSFGANLGVKLSAKQQVRLSAIYNMARDADFPALPMDLRTDDTWMFNAQHDIQIQKDHLKSWNTAVFGSFVDHLMDNLLKPLDPRMLNAKTEAKTYNYGARTEGVWQHAKGKMYTGADMRIEGAQGTRVREFLMGPNAGKTFMDNAWQDGQITKTGLFAEYHLNTSKINYVISGRLEINEADLNEPTSEFTQVNAEYQVSQINPNFSVGARKGLGKDITAGLYLGRAQRSASLTERFINYFPVGQDPYEMLGNPDLAPEVNNQVDLTFELKQENTAFNLDLFAAYMQDYISSAIDTSIAPRLPMSPGVRQYINVDEVFKTGFEFNWIQKLPLGMHHQLGLAYTYAQDLERNEPLAEIPPMDIRYSLRGSYLEDKLNPELVFRYVMEQSRISEEYGETVSPSFSILDLKLGYDLSKNVKINASVTNVLDEAYYEHLNRSVRGTDMAIFAPGRSFNAGISARF